MEQEYSRYRMRKQDLSLKLRNRTSSFSMAMQKREKLRGDEVTNEMENLLEMKRRRVVDRVTLARDLADILRDILRTVAVAQVR